MEAAKALGPFVAEMASAAFADVADFGAPPMLEKRPEAGADAGAGAVVVVAEEACGLLAPPPRLNIPDEAAPVVLGCEVLVELCAEVPNEKPPVFDFSVDSLAGASGFLNEKLPGVGAELAGCDDDGCSGAALYVGKLNGFDVSGLEVELVGCSSFFGPKLNVPPVEPNDWLLSWGCFESSDGPTLPLLLLLPPPPNLKFPKGLLEPPADVVFEALGFAPKRPPPDAEPDA